MKPSAFSGYEFSVCRAVANEIGFPHDEVTSSSSLTADLQLDRFDALELLDALESAFLVSVPDKFLSGFVTVGDIERFIRATRERAAA
jgi:acyl carrier protein